MRCTAILDSRLNKQRAPAFAILPCMHKVHVAPFRAYVVLCCMLPRDRISTDYYTYCMEPCLFSYTSHQQYKDRASLQSTWYV